MDPTFYSVLAASLRLTRAFAPQAAHYRASNNLLPTRALGPVWARAILLPGVSTCL